MIELLIIVGTTLVWIAYKLERFNLERPLNYRKDPWHDRTGTLEIIWGDGHKTFYNGTRQNMDWSDIKEIREV